MSGEADRNFDDLAHRFRRNVYDRLKGEVRLAVLKRDLEQWIPAFAGLGEDKAEPAQTVAILDAGGGQGNLSLELAALGHRVDICDISANMLELARQQCRLRNLGDRVTFIHDSIQNHCGGRPGQYDVVLCHAVLEWVAQPRELVRWLRGSVRPGGYLSLTFYNVNGLIMKNLLRANFKKVLDEDYRGYRGSLTPTWPRATGEVMAWMDGAGAQLLCHSGIRCFHDYLLDPGVRESAPAQQRELELRLSRVEPFRSLGRYIHLLYRTNA